MALGCYGRIFKNASRYLNGFEFLKLCCKTCQKTIMDFFKAGTFVRLAKVPDPIRSGSMKDEKTSHISL
jgi:hypothetical protein